MFDRWGLNNPPAPNHCGMCGCICALGREVCTNCTVRMGQDVIHKLRHVKAAINKGECSDFRDGSIHHRNMRLALDGRRIEAA